MKAFTRRDFLKMAGGLAIGSSLSNYRLLAGPQLAPRVLKAGEPKYNVLLVTIDTLRGDSISLNGSPIVKTPALDRLGQAGTWFTNAIAQQPNTNASHASIFTGVFPFVHGVRQHMIDLLLPNVSTLAEVLDQQGYETAGLYSWVSLEKGFSGLRGFDTYEDLSIHLVPLMRDPRFEDLIVTYRLLGKYLLMPDLIENLFLQGQQDSVEDTTIGRADVTTDAALRWLDANGNGPKPFFLWVHYYDPHYPYQPPAPFDKMYDPDYSGEVDGGMKTVHYIYAHNTGDLTTADVNHIHALYDGAISFADQQLQRLLDEVDRMGLGSNTLVVATADHGESLGTLGRWFHGPRTNYTDIHVPLIFRFPPAIRPNQSISAPVESIDIMPTILDLLQFPIPPIVQGKSLMPLINGTVSQVHPGAISMLDTYGEISYLTENWHLIWDRRSHTSSMYDYHADPLELVDVAGGQSDLVSRLFSDLQQRLRDLNFPNT
jgi:arylsulfatase A-like enzyme